MGPLYDLYTICSDTVYTASMATGTSAAAHGMAHVKAGFSAAVFL